jgi:cytochrome c-type biogenesis protein CcmF
MRVLGEVCLLVCLVATGYGGFLLVVRGGSTRGRAHRVAMWLAVVGLVSLSVTMSILAWALVSRDFRFEYVAQYASRLLPWHYCLSALWVGQAGSLLLWAWMMNVLAVVVRLVPAADNRLRNTACGLLLLNVCFLVIVMVFAADPMAASLIAADDGAGLSPLLQHPSMLIHPPIVFFAYSVWAVPCALALAALLGGRLDTTWTHMARPWALAAWTLLGAGLLLGAHWAYQELGWGGYWGWDPVENGSLLPWLTGTALIHSMMTWRHRGALKKTAVSLAIVTYALCNFATFLTRSGIFSSVHAFSESPIGWLFLGLMSALLVGGAMLLVRRRGALRGQRLFECYWARETLVGISLFLLVSLTVVVLVGTLVTPLSRMFIGRMVQVGPNFYNNVLPPIGLGLLAMTATVPLLRWGSNPTNGARRLLLACLSLSTVGVAIGFAVGDRHPLALAVAGLATFAVAAVLAAWLHDARRHPAAGNWCGLIGALRRGRRKYASYSIHLGFACVAIGVTGSSLGTQRQEVTLDEGDVIRWADREIRYARLQQRHMPDKLVAEAVLEVAQTGASPVELRPARHLHLLQNEWTTEVAIHSTWGGDFYTVLDAGLGDGRVALTLVHNPMMRWIWFGGMLTMLSAVVAIWPARHHRQSIQDVSSGPGGGDAVRHHDNRGWPVAA